jgi:hypothetical protein
LRPTPISHKQAAALGWTRIDGIPGKLRALWAHTSGWRLGHCGHPTALYPWALFDPKGRMHLSGANGPAKNPTFGVAWSDLREPMTYVAEQGPAAVKRMDEIERVAPTTVKHRTGRAA